MSARGLVRVTVASRTRRVDLVLPGAVPVAELVPELARSVGLLDPATAHGGYRLVTQGGRVLAGDSGLTFQGIEDGRLLTVTAGVDDVPPRVYDDVVEAMADVIEREVEPWPPASATSYGVVGRRAADGTRCRRSLPAGLPRCQRCRGGDCPRPDRRRDRGLPCPARSGRRRGHGLAGGVLRRRHGLRACSGGGIGRAAHGLRRRHRDGCERGLSRWAREGPHPPDPTLVVGAICLATGLVVHALPVDLAFC